MPKKSPKKGASREILKTPSDSDMGDIDMDKTPTNIPTTIPIVNLNLLDDEDWVKMKEFILKSGNNEIISSLVPEVEPVVIQISASLEPDSQTFSGYEWSSSSGPNLEISTGTTASARIEVEERAPITFVFPILRSVSGIY